LSLAQKNLLKWKQSAKFALIGQVKILAGSFPGDVVVFIRRFHAAVRFPVREIRFVVLLQHMV